MYEFEQREHWAKTTISDLKTNYDAESNTVLQKKKKTNNNCRKQTELEQTEDDANNMR